MRPFLVLFGLLVLAVFVVGCGSSSDVAQEKAPTAAGQSESDLDNLDKDMKDLDNLDDELNFDDLDSLDEDLDFDL